MWQFFFWLSVGVVLYCYVGYPLILLLLGKFSRRNHHTPRAEYHPSICLIVSAFNEEKVIRKKIENSLALEYPRSKYSILVASDGSTDRTLNIAREYLAQGVSVYHRPSRIGKSGVLNEVVGTLTQDVVIFTDANCLFAKDALTKLVRHFHNPDIGCVVGKLRYADRRTSAVGKGENLYWRYESKISVLESLVQSVLVANGSIFAIRRCLFTDLYPEVANDFQLPIEIASEGYGVIYDPEALALEHSTIFWQEEFQRKVRIIVRGLTGYSLLRHKLRGFRRWQFFSHKLLRWGMCVFLFGALFTNAMSAGTSALYTGLLGMQMAFYFAALNGWRIRRTKKPRRIFYLPFYFTMVNLAALYAISMFLVGKRQTVWEKAESARFSPASVPGDEISHRLMPEPAKLAAMPGIDAEPDARKVAKP